MAEPHMAVGKPADRADAIPKVTGRAKFAAEVDAPGLCHAAVVTSTVARGRVTGYDTAAAEKVPGLIAVVTPRNVGPMKAVPRDLIPGDRPPLELRPPLADDRVQHFGQAVAVVVAETFEAATFAAARVKVSYAAEDPVLHPEQADATAFEPEKFAGREELQIKRGDVAKGLADAAVRVEAVYRTPVEHHHPIEPAATVAVWDGDTLTLHDSSRFVHGTKKVAAAVFGLPAEKVRVVSPFVGGAFGSKGFTWQHNLLAAAAARQVKRPVKLVLTRAQMFTLAGRRPETRQAVTLGAAKDGRLTALRHRSTTDTSTLADFIEPCGTLSKHLYSCPNVEIGHRVVRLNRASPVFMRAPGETPGSFALESALDELAVAAGLDPVELRLRNHADRDEQEDKPWSSKHLKECYRIAAERFGWLKRDPRPRAMRDGRLLVGWGMATAAYPANRMEASAKVRLTADGRAIASSGTHEIGNGAYTIMARIAADALGLAAERVRFELGDTILPFAPAAGGSWSTASVGPAIIAAAEAVKAKVVRMAIADRASPLFGVAADQVVCRDGALVHGKEEGKRDAVADVLRRAGKKEVEAEASAGPGEEKKKFSFLSFGAHFVEVKVDPDLPAVRVTRVVSAFDPGAVLNPKAARSQMLGGITMGLGAALLEHTVYDPRTGAVVNPDLADYLLPVSADVPAIDVAFVNEPDLHFNPTGGRGLGELGVPGVAAAVANAAFHATGKRVRDLPVTPDKLL